MGLMNILLFFHYSLEQNTQQGLFILKNQNNEDHNTVQKHFSCFEVIKQPKRLPKASSLIIIPFLFSLDQAQTILSLHFTFPLSSNITTSKFQRHFTLRSTYNFITTQPMAHELNMSLTNYMQIKDLLVPKHLAVSQNSRKKLMFKRDFLVESPADVAQQHKIKRLKPIGEIQTIMKHFDAKFHNHKVKPSFFAKPAERHKHPGSAHNDSQHQLQKKMNYLINLPVIKTIKKEAERYRNIINADQIKEREQRKARIVDNFNEYMEAELKGNSNLERKKRLHTLG